MTNCSKTCVETQTDTNRKVPLVRTESIVTRLKAMPNGWGGLATSKKPGPKTLRKMKKILAVLEAGRSPWPEVTVVPNGCVILGWFSLTRDMQMNIDTDGDVQFVTTLKHIDEQGNVANQLESEGHVLDMLTVDHMTAWFCADKSFAA